MDNYHNTLKHTHLIKMIVDIIDSDNSQNGGDTFRKTQRKKSFTIFYKRYTTPLNSVFPRNMPPSRADYAQKGRPYTHHIRSTRERDSNYTDHHNLSSYNTNRSETLEDKPNAV